MIHREELEAIAVKAADLLQAKVGQTGSVIVILSSEEQVGQEVRAEYAAVSRGGQISILRGVKFGAAIIEGQILGMSMKKQE
jgi:hypothetical protein